MSRANPLMPPLAPRGRAFPKGAKNPGYGAKTPGAGRKAGVPNKVPVPFKQFLLSILDNEQYRLNVTRRLLEAQGGPLELLAAHWHGGKPKETLEVKGETLDAMYALAASKGLVKKGEERADGPDERG
jgi:hypothetical protein